MKPVMAVLCKKTVFCLYLNMRQLKITIISFFSFLVLSLIVLFVTPVKKINATNYYLSPDGDNNNNGSINSPWATVQYSLSRLSPGDVLNLRQGSYYENNISVNLIGTTSAPITIQSYQGERAAIDGGVPHFKNISNNKEENEWELVDNSIDLYRSRRTFSGNYVQAWVLDYDSQLMEYDTTSRMDSTNYTVNGLNNVYSGPGVQMRNGHVYIRLTLGDYDKEEYDGSPINFPTNPNPNNLSIAVYTSQRILNLNGSSHLVFKDLDLVHSSHAVDMSAGTNHILFDGCYVKHGVIGISSNGTSDVEIRNCEFNGGIPRYFYWTDLKDSSDPSEAGPEFQTFTIVGAINNFNIHHNIFRNLMDAMNIRGGSSNVTIKNNIFKETHDDAINFQTNVDNIEVSHNMFWHVLAGIAILGDNGSPGNVYIHHNVIDNSQYQMGGRPNCPKSVWPQWTTGSIFSAHGGLGRSGWKIYNNTFVSRVGGYGHSMGPDTCIDNPEKYVYNNLWVALNDMPILNGGSPAHYGGNLVWQVGVENSVNSTHGQTVNPGFNINAIDDPVFDPNTIWDRYYPNNPEVFTTGVSYAGLNWHGTKGPNGEEIINYRGAIGPGGITDTSPPTSPTSPPSSCTPPRHFGNALRANGACDNDINMSDYATWFREFFNNETTLYADFNRDGVVNRDDLPQWINKCYETNYGCAL